MPTPVELVFTLVAIELNLWSMWKQGLITDFVNRVWFYILDKKWDIQVVRIFLIDFVLLVIWAQILYLIFWF